MCALIRGHFLKELADEAVKLGLEATCTSPIDLHTLKLHAPAAIDRHSLLTECSDPVSSEL